ncbi:MAG: peroxiredoxin, partial [Bdellovibrionaceae bacterium]|nr:peroxiredoxin [Pseudobdellovibrionaceae bacterium]
MKESFMKFFNLIILSCAIFGFTSGAMAELKVNEAAPVFTAKTQENKDFDLNSRKGKWTVLYFYPKAGTPGCTKQACAFRDNIKKIRAQGADVVGISADTVAEQA